MLTIMPISKLGNDSIKKSAKLKYIITIPEKTNEATINRKAPFAFNSYNQSRTSTPHLPVTAPIEYSIAKTNIKQIITAQII